MSSVAEAASRNFTLRLSEADHAQLAALASRWEMDRTAVLRRLVRRAVPTRPLCGLFIPVGSMARQPLPIGVVLREETA